jgi:hypothetical protein
MALAALSGFGSFDVTDGSQIRDISSVLSEALIFDFEFLGQGCNVSLDNPVEDTVFYWNEETLNAATVESDTSISSAATSFALASGHGGRVKIGDLLKVVDEEAKLEVMQITDVSTDTLTVTRGYNSTSATTHADASTFAVIPASQEGSDFGTGSATAPAVRSNSTQIIFAKDLLITRSQLQRKMATVALDVDRQLASRAKELKRYWTNAALYSIISGTPAGSDSVYRTMKGMAEWIVGNGVVDSDNEALSLGVLDSVNKQIVDLGEYPDTLLIGTDLVGGVNSIDASNRRALESETQMGYIVNQIRLGQGNLVNVVVDSRVATGDAFLYKKESVSLRPLPGSAMFTIAATDFVDGVKRRVGSEMGLEFRQPQAAGYLYTKSAS